MSNSFRETITWEWPQPLNCSETMSWYLFQRHLKGKQPRMNHFENRAYILYIVCVVLHYLVPCLLSYRLIQFNKSTHLLWSTNLLVFGVSWFWHLWKNYSLSTTLGGKASTSWTCSLWCALLASLSNSACALRPLVCSQICSCTKLPSPGARVGSNWSFQRLPGPWANLQALCVFTKCWFPLWNGSLGKVFIFCFVQKGVSSYNSAL